MYTVLHVESPLLLSDFNETWIFPDRISKNAQISKITLTSVKIVRWPGAMN